jgi:hypothetical protein
MSINTPNCPEYIKTKQASSLLNVSAQTLRNKAESGYLRTCLTSGSHRMYLKEDVLRVKYNQMATDYQLIGKSIYYSGLVIYMDQFKCFENKGESQGVRPIRKDIFIQRSKNEISFEQIEELIHTGRSIYYNPLLHKDKDHLGLDNNRVYTYGLCLVLSRRELELALSHLYDQARDWMRENCIPQEVTMISFVTKNGEKLLDKSII